MITVFKLSQSKECPSKENNQIVIDLSKYSKSIGDLLMQESKRQCKKNPKQEKLTITFDGTQKNLSNDIYTVLLYEQKFASPVWKYYKEVTRVSNRHSIKDRDTENAAFVADHF